MNTTILSLGHHVPGEKEVVGVRRPIAEEPGGPSALVEGAARDALAGAGMESGDLDFLIFATMTPDVTFPGSACYLQHRLECGTTGALDIRAQCSGFLFGLMAAEGFVRTGTYRRILLACAEVHSPGLDYSEAGARVSALYGDGAAAVLLGGEDGNRGLQAIACHTDGRKYDRFWCEYPSSRHHPVRVELEQFRAGRHYPTLDFEEVGQFGREHLPSVVREVLASGSVGVDDVDCFVLSHILPEVVADAGADLGVAGDRLIDAGSAHGHLTAATIPVALSEAVAGGRLGKGARVCVAACGAGFTWGAALLTL